MHDFLKRSGRWVRTTWLGPLVLLALPNCTNMYEPFDVARPAPAFDPGNGPLTSAVICDIPIPPDPIVGDCASDQDVLDGIRMAEAGVGLNLKSANSLA